MAKTKTTTKDPLADLKVGNAEAEAELEGKDPELDRLETELAELEAAEAAAAATEQADKDREPEVKPPAAPQEPEPPLAVAPPPRNPTFRVLEDFKGSWGSGSVRLKKGQVFRLSRFGGEKGLEALHKAGARFEYTGD